MYRTGEILLSLDVVEALTQFPAIKDTCRLLSLMLGYFSSLYCKQLWTQILREQSDQGPQCLISW